jgi:hypothetical protein
MTHTETLFDFSDEKLEEIAREFNALNEMCPLSIRKEAAIERLASFPEIALITERGQMFKNQPHHIEWYNILQSKLIQLNHDEQFSPNTLVFNDIGKINKRIALEAPREHSKTTVFSVNYPLWRIVRNPNIRIILVSNTMTQAEAYLREIKGHIERDPVFNGMFGSLMPNASEKWTASEIIVNRDALNLKDPTVSATGMGGVVLSRRAELIIVDDILNPQNTRTEEQRKQVKDWFNNVLLPVLTPDGEVVVVGTAWHKGDILESLIEKSTFDIRVRYKAIPNEGDINPVTGKPKLLWEGLFTYDQYMQKKQDDPVSFYRQYQNDVRQASDAPIKQEYIHYVNEKELPKMARIVIGVDPAVSERDTNETAESAVVATGIGIDKKFYVLEISSGKWSFDVLLSEATRVFWSVKDKYGLRPEAVVVEDVNAQKWAIQQMRSRKLLPAMGVRPNADKTSRLKTLVPFFTNSEIFFVVGCEKLVTELVGWGVERLKDLVDAFVYSIWFLTERIPVTSGNDRPDRLS